MWEERNHVIGAPIFRTDHVTFVLRWVLHKLHLPRVRAHCGAPRAFPGLIRSYYTPVSGDGTSTSAANDPNATAEACAAIWWKIYRIDWQAPHHTAPCANSWAETRGVGGVVIACDHSHEYDQCPCGDITRGKTGWCHPTRGMPECFAAARNDDGKRCTTLRCLLLSSGTTAHHSSGVAPTCADLAP